MMPRQTRPGFASNVPASVRVRARPAPVGYNNDTLHKLAGRFHEQEHRTDAAQVRQKELELALLLVNSLAAPFGASRYRDSYREKLDALIAAKLAGVPSIEAEAPRPAPVVNILDALQRSLEARPRKPALEAPAAQRIRKRSQNRAPCEGAKGSRTQTAARM